MTRFGWLLLGYLLLAFSPRTGGSNAAAAPSDLQGVAESTSSIRWTWSPDAGASYYELHAGTDPTSGSPTVIATGLTSTTHLEESLGENTQHLRHVHSVQGGVLGPPSPMAARFTLIHPARTEDFQVELHSADEAHISIGAPPGAFEGSTGVEVVRTSPSTGIISPFSQTYSALDSHLQPETTYCYNIQFRNGDGIGSGQADASICITTGPGNTAVTDCGLDIKINLLKRTVEGAAGAGGTIHYEFEVITTTPGDCLPADLKVEAEIFGTSDKNKEGPVRIANAVGFPRLDNVTMGAQTFKYKASFDTDEIVDGLKKVKAGSERFVVKVSLRSAKCGCAKQASSILEQPNLAQTPPGITTTLTSKPCMGSLTASYAMANTVGGETKLAIDYKTKLEPDCTPGSLETEFFPFVVVENKEVQVVFPGKNFDRTDVPAPSFAVLHEFSFKTAEVEKAIKNAVPGKSAEQLQEIRKTLYFVVNSTLTDSCGCIFSLAKKVRGTSVGATTPCELTVKITSLVRTNLPEQANFDIKVTATFRRKCAHLEGELLAIQPIIYQLVVTGRVVDPKTGLGKVVVLTSEPRTRGAAGPAAGGDPVVANLNSGPLFAKFDKIRKAIEKKQGFVAGSLRVTASVEALDYCGCQAADSVSIPVPDLLQTTTGNTTYQGGALQPCAASLEVQGSMAETPAGVFITAMAITTIGDPECLNGECRIVASLSSEFTVNGRLQSEILLNADDLAPVKTLSDVVSFIFPGKKEIWAEDQIAAAIVLKFPSATTEEQKRMIRAALEGGLSARLDDDCGCLATRSIVLHK